MMRSPNLPVIQATRLLLLMFMAGLLTACPTFPAAYRKMMEGNKPEARAIFKKNEKHRVYGPGATYYKVWLDAERAFEISELGSLHSELCGLDKRIAALPFPAQDKLSKYKVAPHEVLESVNKLERRIVAQLCENGTVTDLDAVHKAFLCWRNEEARDSITTIIVNRSLAPAMPVYEDACEQWKRPMPDLTPVDINDIKANPGLPCADRAARAQWDVNYEQATSIIQRYRDAVLDENINEYWQLKRDIWNTFQMYESYCEMNRFKEEHPWDAYSLDCWFDEVRDTLCLSDLESLLTFHNNNPHTAFDTDICTQILCLSALPDAMSGLDTAQYKHVEDVQLMFELQQRLLCGTSGISDEESISQLKYLAEKYTGHKVIFDLTRTLGDNFINNGKIAAARKLVEILRPLIPDGQHCSVPQYFHNKKQQWFESYAALLARTPEDASPAKSMTAWNTPANDEYALVSWGSNDEVFFVRRNRADGTASVMTSTQNNSVWTAPVPVKELSVANDVVLLSMSENGQMMLLQSGGKLLQAFRRDLHRPWTKPDPIPMTFLSRSKATLSPDGSMMVLSQYAPQKNELLPPSTDIFVSYWDERSNRYGTPKSVGKIINTEGSSEANPLIASGGRMMIFTSDRPGGLGGSDTYSAVLETPGDWNTVAAPQNMGFPLNTTLADKGLTFYSEYDGRGYFDRKNPCEDDIDIWMLPGINAELFPEALRLAGIVIDENGQPVKTGFMEFTTNYSLSVHSQALTESGTYSFTTPDTSRVVRLFPEVPGYYSERDTTYFLDNIPKGELIRDTFQVTSFEYIRRNFSLQHSTFYQGTAQFDNPTKAYPELTRFAKIATRMGAELELTGHTDNVGTPESNDALSLQRAMSVKQYLVEKCGFDPAKIKVSAKGGRAPIASNDSEEGRRLNRRIEVVFKMPKLTGPGDGGR
jgi:outer membrane protein OmpA-like peptidoglycan-associated protein